MKHRFLAFLTACLFAMSATAAPNFPAACDVPAGLSTSGVTTNSATFSWDAVAGASGYIVSWHIVGNSSWLSATVVGGNTTYTVTGLASGTNYEWKAKALCSGTTSDFSAAQPFTTLIPPCGIPTGLTTTNITQNSALLSWSAVSGAASYRVNWRVVGTNNWLTVLVTAPATSHTLQQLLANTNYEWKVKTLCTNSGESDFSAVQTFTTQATPSCGVPTGLSTTNIGPNSAKFNWLAVNGATSYSFSWRVVGSSTWSSSYSSLTSYTATGLLASTSYEWKVLANCNGAVSDYSPLQPFTTLPPATCDVPTGLTTTNITSSSAQASWSAVAGAAGYWISWKAVGTPNSGAVYVTAPTTTWAMVSLAPGTNYEWKVRTICTNGGESAYSAGQPFTTLGAASCGVPTGLATSNITPYSATLTWNSVAGALNYTVAWRIVGSSAWSTATVTSTAYSVGGLFPNTNYEWKVKAACSNSTSSDYSPVQTFTTLSPGPCGIPTGLTTTNITQNSALLSWSAVSGAASYRVNWRAVGATNWSTTLVTAPTTSFTLSQLSPSINYEWKVKTLCTNGGESDFSAVQTFTTLAAASCGIPTGLTTTNITSNSAQFSWGAVTGASGYQVTWRVVGSSAWVTATVVAPITSYTATGLLASTSYEWKVKTYCSGTTSDFSAVATFTTLAPPPCAIPTGLTTTNITQSSAALSWSAVSGAASYRVNWHVVGSANWSTALVTAPTTTFTLAQLSPNSNYEWKVKTLCTNGGESDFSPVQTFTTLVAVGCGIPTGLSTSNISHNSAKYNWTAVSGAAYYIVNWRVVGTNSWQAASVVAPTVTYTATGLIASTNYQWKVKSVCTNGTSSDFSPVQTFTTLAPPPCDIPTGLVTTNITATSALASWGAVAGATNYRINWHVVGASTWSTALVAAPATSKSLTGLLPNANYEWKVKTLCGNGGESAFSAVSTFTTLPNLAPPGNGFSLVKNPTTTAEIWPNPADDLLEISLGDEAEGPVSIELFNLRGELAFSKKLEAATVSSTVQFDTSSLPSGIYLLEIGSVAGREARKVVVQH